MCALSNVKCIHLLSDTMSRSHVFASIRILYMPPGSHCILNTLRSHSCPGQSSPSSLSSLIVSSETIREGSFFLYLLPTFILLVSYYSLLEVIYEAFSLSAFLMLLVQIVASTATSHSAVNALMRKDKTRLPIPLCCWRFRPSKPYFMYTLKWSVMQYTIVRPGQCLFSMRFRS